MKARFSGKTAGAALNAAQREACDVYIRSEWKRHKETYTRRILLAVALALNDIAHFGDKRIMYILKAIEDITQDYSERAYTAQEAHTDIALQEDKMADLMQEELLSRKGIHVKIT